MEECLHTCPRMVHPLSAPIELVNPESKAVRELSAAHTWVPDLGPLCKSIHFLFGQKNTQAKVFTCVLRNDVWPSRDTGGIQQLWYPSWTALSLSTRHKRWYRVPIFFTDDKLWTTRSALPCIQAFCNPAPLTVRKKVLGSKNCCCCYLKPHTLIQKSKCHT